MPIAIAVAASATRRNRDLSIMDAASATTTIARVNASEDVARLIADALAARFETAAVAAYEDPAGQWSVEAYFDQVPDHAVVRAAVANAGGESSAQTLTFATVQARDWTAASLAGLHPVTAGRFTIHGAHDRLQIVSNRVGIEIEAALAFGTGHHGTTRGCLLALEQIIKKHHPRRILDVGTGTGVLAIAAAKALRRRVLASDIDREAVRIAQNNARANHAGCMVQVVHAAGLSAGCIRESAPFELVFANILLGPLKTIATPMARILAPHARVVLSGLLTNQANAALSAYHAHGLRLETRIVLDGWATLQLTTTSP
jgi:ribosomal protein L11 methyltransferase